jgi:hypothetical protein
VTSTRLPGLDAPLPSARRAVSPAIGRVAASSKATASGSAARNGAPTVTYSAQAPTGSAPTTRAPFGGPEPSAAASATTPA